MKTRIGSEIKRAWKWGIIAAPLVVALSCGKPEQPSEAAHQGGPAVTVTDAVSRTVPIYLDEIGKTSAAEIVTVQPQVTGVVTGIHFSDGAFVKKGQLLYSIDPRPFQAALDQAQAQLVQSQAQYQFAKTDFARVQKLKGTKAISEEQYDTKQNAVAVAAAQIQASKAAVELAKLNLGYCQIRSPINGRTGQHLVDVGNVVNAGGANGGTNLLVITRIDPIYADFTVTENDLATVKQYMQHAKGAEKNLQVLVSAPNAVNVVEQALGSQKSESTTQPAQIQREGKLEFLNNIVQDGTGTVKLRAAVPNADHYFWPGQYISVRLILTMDKNAVLIPSQAIQISQTGPFVFVATAQNKAEQRAIVSGQKHGSMVVINSGVYPGERVITTGQMLLSEGMPVTIVPLHSSTKPSSKPATQSAMASGPNPKSEARNSKQTQHPKSEIQNDSGGY